MLDSFELLFAAFGTGTDSGGFGGGIGHGAGACACGCPLDRRRIRAEASALGTEATNVVSPVPPVPRPDQVSIWALA